MQEEAFYLGLVLILTLLIAHCTVGLAVAAFAQKLRNSEYSKDLTYEEILKLADENISIERKQEFLRIVMLKIQASLNGNQMQKLEARFINNLK